MQVEQHQRLTEATEAPWAVPQPLGRQHLSHGSRVATRVCRSHVCRILSMNYSGTEMKLETHPVLRLAPPFGPYGEGYSQRELPWGQRGSKSG